MSTSISCCKFLFFRHVPLNLHQLQFLFISIIVFSASALSVVPLQHHEQMSDLDVFVPSEENGVPTEVRRPKRALPTSLRFHRLDPKVASEKPAECSEAQMLLAEGAAEAILSIMMKNGGQFTEQFAPTDEQEELLIDGAEKAIGKNCSRKYAKRRRRKEGGGKADEIKPDMPLDMRAMCPFERHINFDGQRLPKRIPEVRCLCTQPRPSPNSPHQSDHLRCEPLYHNIRVLKFEPGCQKFRLVRQRISMGCVASFQDSAPSQFMAKIGQLEAEDTEVEEMAIR